MIGPVPHERRRVSLVIIATGRYDRFLPSLVASARTHVVSLHRVFVLADVRPPTSLGVTWLPWGHVGWPYPTLLRFRAISAYADELSDTDILVYVDVDMLFTGEVDLTRVDGLVAVQHPGFVSTHPSAFPYERRPESRVHILEGSGTHYLAGGVQGGAVASYLLACSAMSAWVQQDLAAGVVPVWHDESVWNKWCLENPPSSLLDPTYCTPEPQRGAGTRIVALDKNHDVIREVPMPQRWAKRLKQLRGRAWRRIVIPTVRVLSGRR